MRCSRSMDHSLGYHESLSRCQYHVRFFEIDHELPVETKEELIVVLVLMPMIFALHHTQPDNRTVHLAKRLIVPLIGNRIDERRDVHPFQLLERKVKVRRVREHSPPVMASTSWGILVVKPMSHVFASDRQRPFANGSHVATHLDAQHPHPR